MPTLAAARTPIAPLCKIRESCRLDAAQRGCAARDNAEHQVSDHFNGLVL